MSTWRRVSYAPARRCMGAVIVHRRDEEPVVLQEASARIWDALEEPRTENEICSILGATETDIAHHVRDAVGALASLGVVTRSA